MSNPWERCVLFYRDFHLEHDSWEEIVTHPQSCFSCERKYIRSIRAEGQYSLQGVCSWRKITRFLLRSVKLQITRRNSCWEERRFVSKKKHFHNWNSKVGVNITFLKRSDKVSLFRYNVIFLLWIAVEITCLLDSQRSDIFWHLSGRISLFSWENNLFKVKILSLSLFPAFFVTSRTTRCHERGMFFDDVDRIARE